MREACPKMCNDLGKPVIKHFYDLWHIGKSKYYIILDPALIHDELLCIMLMHFNILYNYIIEIQKILIKLAKEKNCEVIGKWRKACVQHFYWAATSTLSGIGEVKWAKFESFFYHIINRHKDFPNKIFNKCNHCDILKP